MVTIEERVTVPHTAFDHSGYRCWVTSDDFPDGIRTTFVDGEVLVEMTPVSLDTHSLVKGAVTAALWQFVRDNNLGELYPDGTLVTNEAARLSCEPDATFVSWHSFESGLVRLVPRADGLDYIEVLGSPDLVIEIVSKTSVRKDTKLLREAYARAAIREYWLIDARRDQLRFEILSNRDGSFVSSADALATQSSTVLGGTWQLVRERNRIGHYSYSLVRS